MCMRNRAKSCEIQTTAPYLYARGRVARNSMGASKKRSPHHWESLRNWPASMLGHMHHMRGISGNEGNFDGLAENVRTCSVGFVAQGEQEKSNFRPPPAPCLQSLGPIPSSRTYAGRKSMQPPRFGQNSLIWFRMPCSSWVPWCPSLPETNNICRNFCENRKRTD